MNPTFLDSEKNLSNISDYQLALFRKQLSLGREVEPLITLKLIRSFTLLAMVGFYNG